MLHSSSILGAEMRNSWATAEARQLYVVGGKRKQHGSRVHEKGLVARLDTRRGTAEICFEYAVPNEMSGDDDSIIFKSATLQDRKLYICTDTEVMIFEIPHFKRISYISLPCFNDLHHVRPTGNSTLLVAVTGLDMVIEIDLEGRILREWDVLGGKPWSRFSPEVDYRAVSTKPHGSHPNYVFQVGEDLWVTRFEQKDAICLTNKDRRISIGFERPHDGIVCDGAVYFTTVDGHVVVANLQTGELDHVADLNQIAATDMRLGWCRGLLVLGRNNVVVGFSRFRSTKFRENVRWVGHHLGLPKALGRPTRIAHYDLRARELCWEIDLETIGLETVFSIHQGNF